MRDQNDSAPSQSPPSPNPADVPSPHLPLEALRRPHESTLGAVVGDGVEVVLGVLTRTVVDVRRDLRVECGAV